MKIKEFKEKLEAFQTTDKSKKIAFLKKVITESKKEKNHTVYQSASYQLALCYFKSMEITKAKKILDSIVLEIPYHRFVTENIRVFNLMGAIEQIMENNELSLYFYQQALKLAKKHKIYELEHMIYSNMAILYSNKDDEACISCILLAIEKKKKLDDESSEKSLAKYYKNLCIEYKLTGQYDKAFEALDICENKYNGNKYEEDLIDTCKLDLYYRTKQLDQFYIYKKKIEANLKNSKFNYNSFISCQALSEFYLAYKDYDGLKNIIGVLEKYIEKNKNEEIEYFIYDIKYEYSKAIEDYKLMAEILLKQRELLVKKQKELVENSVKTMDARLKLANMDAKATATKKLNSILRKQIQTDILTGLSSRQSFNSNINIKNRKIYKASSLAFIIIDVDNFKNINDTYGHLQGDIVLEQVGHVMNNLKDDRIEFYRFGGDEFIAVLYNYSKDDVKKIAVDIKNNVEKINVLDNYKVSVTQGIYYRNSSSSEELAMEIGYADKALYSGKENKGSITFYT